jgi:hypothetical protein
MKCKPFLALFVLSLLHWRCKDNQPQNIILEIGKYKLLSEDFNSIKRQYTGRLSTKQLEDKLIQEGYILADAIERRYDTIRLLSQRLNFAIRYQVSKIDGYLWNKNVKPQLTVTDKDIQEAFQKRSNQYTLEVIHFPNRNLLASYLSNQTNFLSGNEFLLLKKKVSSNPQIASFTLQETHPFFPFGAYTDGIIKMKEGEVVGPIETTQGFIVIYLSKISGRSFISFQQDKPAIKEALLKVLKEKYQWESQKRIFSAAKLSIDDRAVVEVASKYDVSKKQWLNADGQKTLMTYQLDGKKHIYRVSDLTHDYQYQPIFFGSLNNPLDVREFLKRYVIETYLFEEVSKLKADKEYAFLKKKQQEQIWLGYFQEQKIMPRLLVTDAEVNDYYNKNKKDFESFGQATVRVFKFRDGISATRAYSSILSTDKAVKQTAQTTYPGLLSTQTLVIRPSDTTLNENLIDVVSSQKQGTNRPINMGNEFWISQVLNKEGSSVLPLVYVRKKIKGVLLDRKRQEVFKNQMDVLHASYRIKINRLSKM